MSAVENLITGAVGVGAGAYLLAVASNGNTVAFLDAIKEEKGYAEFLVALAVMAALHAWPPTRKLSGVMLALAVLAVLLKVGNTLNLSPSLEAFASGRAGLFDTVAAIFGAE